MGQSGSLGNNTGTTRLGEFWDRIWYSCVYTKFGHLENTFMGNMFKSLVGEFVIEEAAYVHDSW